MGNTSQLAVCKDGMTVAQWEAAGAAKKGISIEQWRQEVVDTLAKATPEDVAAAFGRGTSTDAQAYQAQAGTLSKQFNEVSTAFSDPAAKTKTPTPWSSSDQLQGLLEGKVPGFSQYGGPKTGYNQYKRPMWWYLLTKGYVIEADWQHETSVSWVDQAGKKVYVSPETPYAVTRPNTDFAFPMGSILKLAQKGGNGVPTYAQVLEAGPGIYKLPRDAKNNKLELSKGTWDRLGKSEGKVGKGYSLDYSKVTEGGKPGAAGTQLTGDQIQLAGALGDAKMLSRSEGAISVNDLSNSLKKHNITPDNIPPKLQESLNDGGKRAIEDLDAKAKAQGGQASASAGGGRYQLVKGFPTVATGKDQRLVGYANAACLHTGGGYVIEGSSTVYVGQFPIGRVADGTSDGYAVTTGDDTVFVGGTPTSAQLA
jgi:hypothetical protein